MMHREIDAWRIFIEGRIYQEREDFVNALAAFDKVLSIDPSHTYAKVTKGCVLARLDRMDDSISTFDELIGSYSNSHNLIQRFRVLAALNNKAYHLLQKSRFSESLDSINEMIDKFIADPDPVLNSRAIVAIKTKITLLRILGRHAEALACEEKNISLLEKIDGQPIPPPPANHHNPIAKSYTDLTVRSDLDETGKWIEELEKILKLPE